MLSLVPFEVGLQTSFEQRILEQSTLEQSHLEVDVTSHGMCLHFTIMLEWHVAGVLAMAAMIKDLLGRLDA